MTRRLIALVLAACFALLPLSTVHADKSYYAERYDVDLFLGTDASLKVTETVAFRFEGGEFTYVFREIPHDQLDRITDLAASMDGVALPEGDQPGQVEISGGDPLRVTWHFAPTMDATHEFGLSYRVTGVVRDEPSGDLLWWNVLPPDHEYDIRASTITFRYPEAPGLVELPSISRAGAQPLTNGNGEAHWQLGASSADVGAELQARFDSGFVSAPANWQAAQSQRAANMAKALPAGLLAALGTGGLGLVLLALFSNRHKRDITASAYSAGRPVSPPSDIAPGLAARLAGKENSALATLFDLARRGILGIEAERGFLKSKKYILVQQPGEHSLRPHEEAFLAIVFSSRRGMVDRIPLTQVGEKLGQHSSEFKQALDEEMNAAGWIDAQRKSTRQKVIMVCLGLVVLALLVFFLGLMLPVSVISGLVVGGGAGLMLTAIAVGIFGANYSQLTETGERQAEAWKGYGSYLRDVARGREAAMRPDAFDQFLPLAAGFGLANQWVKFFERQGNTPLPGWYRGAEASMNDFNDITAVVAATSSSADGGAASAGGASGGGSSGAG